MRVLHLIDPSSPGGGACTLRLLADVCEHLSSIEHDVLVLGNGHHQRLAERCGLDTPGLLPMPRSVPVAGRRALARYLSIADSARGPFDLIHTWTARSALVATMAASDRPRIGTLSVGPVSGLSMHLLATLIDEHPMPMLATSTAVREEFWSLGLKRQQVSVLPPAVNSGLIDDRTRDDLRGRWEVGPDTFVIGLLSEPVSWADAMTAGVVATRLIASGRDVRVLIHPTAARRPEALRFAREFGAPDLFIVDDDVAEPWEVVAGMDAALLIGGDLNTQDLSAVGSPFSLITGGGRRLRPMPGVMPLLWAMAAGVPVIAEASDAVRDIVEEGISGLLVRQHDVNGTCDRLARLHDDRTIAGRIGVNARTLIDDRFSLAGYSVRLKSAYEHAAAGKAIVVGDDVNEPVVELA